MITLYTIHCPKCRVLEMKLKQTNLEFTTIDDEDAVVEVGKMNGIIGAPILQVDDKFLDFNAAVKFVNNNK